jgi:hypothetical protein
MAVMPRKCRARVARLRCHGQFFKNVFVFYSDKIQQLLNK